MDDELGKEIEPAREDFYQNRAERGESRRELEQATAEAVLSLFRGSGLPAEIRLQEALSRYRKCRGIEE